MLGESGYRLRQQVITIDDKRNIGVVISKRLFYPWLVLFARLLLEPLLVLCQFIPNGVEAVVRMDGVVIRADFHLPSQCTKRPRDRRQEVMEVGTYEEEAIHVIFSICTKRSNNSLHVSPAGIVQKVFSSRSVGGKYVFC